MKKILIKVIDFYCLAISPWLGSCCRFTPSCSEYAKQSIQVHGTLKGLYLILFRIIRCQPFCQGGLDSVKLNSKIK